MRLHLIILASALAATTLASTQSVAQKIRKLDASWNKSSKSVSGWTSFYAPDAVVMAPNAPIADTPAKIHAVMSDFLGLPKVAVSWTCEKVQVSRAADMAYCYGHYKVSFADHGKTVTDKGKSLEIWRKQPNGSWKCAVDVWNTDLPAGS